MNEYRIFKRKAWLRNKDYPGGWEPYGSARKTTACFVGTIDEAQRICKEHNDNRKTRGDTFCEFEKA